MKHLTWGIAILFLLSVAAGCGSQPASAAPTPLPTFSPPTPQPGATEAGTSTAHNAAFPQPSESNPPIRFAIIGDYGMEGQSEADVAALVKSWEPDFIITLGDNNYLYGSAATIDRNIGQYYHEYIGSYQGSYGEGSLYPRLFPSMGNHDWETDDGQPYLDYFTLPGNERYYEFIWGPVHFFALSSDSREPDGVSASSVQATWLQEALAAAQEPWNIVYMHHPPYSSGEHGPSDWMQWPFAEWGASAVLAGHDHIYERLQVDGLLYFVNGLGGARRYDFDNLQPQSQARFSGDYGAMLVTASEAAITFQFITRGGEVIDRYTLLSSTALPNAQTLPDPAAYQWKLVTQGLEKPVGLVHAGDGSGRLFVIEQRGAIRIIQNGELLPTPFLDIRDRVGSEGGEQGLLGLAFHPNYVQNGYFFVNYTDRRGDTVVARYRVSADPNLADPASEQVVLTLAQPYGNHNGGHLLFGPDSYLYIGTGDGGLFGDPHGNAQNLDSLLGKMLRLDVDELPYRIPPDNPFGDEIWAYGLRNPWRYSFDRLTGDLYLADVGQNQWEEIDFLEAGAPAGVNFGWDFWEGSHPYEGTPPEGFPMNFPVAEYDHSQGCSVTGGVVYRGALPDWQGVYLYGDYCSGRIWGLLRTAEGEWLNEPLFESGFNIATFGEDENGEVYLTHHGEGSVYRLTARP